MAKNGLILHFLQYQPVYFYVQEVLFLPVTHTPSGDRWRSRLSLPNGSFPPRVQTLECEQQFWSTRMKKGAPAPDAYADTVFSALMAQVGALPISSVLEIGPGWGNYTFPLVQKFPRVTVVDISPDNLNYLSEHSSALRNPIHPICGAWETAAVAPHDLVFGYNCLYRLKEPELFLQKVTENAKLLCVLGMNCPPELPWLPSLEAAGIPIHATCQGCEELYAILMEMGIRAKLISIANHRTYCYDSKEALLQRAEGFLTEPCSRDKLLSILLAFHTEAPDGRLRCEYPFTSQLLVWEPSRLSSANAE